MLGLAVSGACVRAALVERGKLAWAGSASYQTREELVEVIARLAGESGKSVGRVRVALTRGVVQLRTVHPAPPVKPRDVRRYVSLEATRLFRKNGAPLVTDGALVAVTKGDAALWAAAAAEPLLSAILDGCAQAGLAVEALAPSADTLPAALQRAGESSELIVPNGGCSEQLSLGVGGVWRSRWSREMEASTLDWVPALSALNGDASAAAPAYAAAVQLPTLALLPEDHRRAHRRSTVRRHALMASVGLALWLAAAGTYLGRLSWAYTRSTHLLEAFRGAADSALAVRRDLDAGRATLATIADARVTRSRTLPLLASLTRGLPDSVTLIAFRIGSDGTVRLAGYAPRASQVLAEVERVPGLTGAALDGSATQENLPTVGVRDRFSIVATVGRP